MKICVADDEKEVRESIIHKLKTLFPSDEIYDIEYGRLALERIVLVRPDLVFMDIRMPDMDGLAILREAKKDFPDIKAVILSGYDDFEYARKALQFGAVDYLLKPADREQLKSIVESRKQEMLQAFLQDLEVSLAKLSELYLFVHHIQVFDTSLWFDDRKPKQVVFGHSATPDENEASGNSRVLMSFSVDEDGKGAVVSAASESVNGFHSKRDFVQAMLSGLEQWESRRFFADGAELLQQTESLGKHSARHIPALRHQILSSAKAGEDSSLETALNGWLAELALLDFGRLKKECVNLMALLDEGLVQKNEVVVVEEEKLRYWSLWVAKHKTWGELRRNIRKFVLEGVRALKKPGQPASTGWFEFAVQLVSHSRDPNLSLDMVAEEAGVHPVTLSRIFKQQTGMNFVKYLVNVRLANAQALLLQSDKRINEIAEDIGYADYRYFRSLFKKRYGLTPSEYRRTNGVMAPGDEAE